jgi:hypothetical protein
VKLEPALGTASIDPYRDDNDATDAGTRP